MRSLKILKNKYLITSVALMVWLLFFDKNDILSQAARGKELRAREEERDYYQKEIEKNKQHMKELQTNPKNLEKFAREKYLMKKPNEEVFVIVEDPKSN
jgi:cell division protein FtsB